MCLSNSQFVLATPYGYNGLSSRTVDLVGDYAGDGLFIFDGDSLLLHIFSDEKLDFSPGFQLLYATYMVEAFLHALLRRKCHFRIAFFADNTNSAYRLILLASSVQGTCLLERQ